MAGNTTNFRIWVVEAGESEVQADFWLLREFEDSLDYVRHCLKNSRRKEKKSRLEIRRTGEVGHWEMSLKMKFQVDRISKF